MKKGFPYRLYLVISEDACAGRDWLTVAADAIAGGVDLVQYRNKILDDAAFGSQASRLKDITEKAGVPLIINDRLEIAKALGAGGIHVGNNDTQPTKIRTSWTDCGMLGYSIEYLSQLDSAETAASDYLGISPVFRTATKTDTVTEWGLYGIRKIRVATHLPLVAIGNIHAANAAAVIDAGADCLAVVSAICAAQDPRRAAAGLRNAIEHAL